MNFQARILAVLDDSAARSSLTSLTQDRSVNIRVNLTGEGMDLSRALSGQLNQAMSMMGRNANRLGQQTGNMFNRGIRSVRLGEEHIFNTITEEEARLRRANQYATKYNTTQQRALRAINKEATARLRTEEQAARAEERSAQAYARQRQAISDSYYRQRFQSVGQKSPEMQAMANYYRQQEIESRKIAQIQQQIANKTTGLSMAKMESRYGSYNSIGVLENETDLRKSYRQAQQYYNAYNTLNERSKTQSLTAKESEKMIQYYDNWQNAMKTTSNSLDMLQVKMGKPVSALNRNLLTNEIQTWCNNNTRAMSKFGSTLTTLATDAQNAKTSLDFNNVKNQFKEIKSMASAQGLTGRSLFGEIVRGFKQVGQFALTYGIIQRVVMNGSRQMVQSVLDVNKAMIELQKVSTAPNSDIKAYFSEAAESAKLYGATISDVISSTADWSRLGYNFEDAKVLSNATTLIQKVGDNMTQESSAEGLISTLRGFGKEADEVMEIVDAVNQVANTQPIDTAGLFEALSRSSSSMAAANNTMEETIGLITAANSVVQNPATVGTAYKTISMRIRGRFVPIYSENYSPCCAI